MENISPSDIPAFPMLRAVDPQWVQHQGQTYLSLRDPLALSDQTVLVPRPLAPLLALCDGTRDVSALRTGLALRVGVALTTREIEEFLLQLDRALLLDNGLYRQASTVALEEYRKADSRRPSHAGSVYPADPGELAETLKAYLANLPDDEEPPSSADRLVGMVCPHIDYERGHETYARLWRRAAPGLGDVELAIIFGTDHAGGPGKMTPTGQSYMTPLGVMPTERDIVNGLAEVLGTDVAFTEEIHHIREHSIELPLVWLQYFLEGRSCPIVPILCGSFQHFVSGEKNAEDDQNIGEALKLLREATAGRRTLVIAGADLAHVGPAFGDAIAIDDAGRSRLAVQDEASIASVCRGDATSFLEQSLAESDARRLCGLPPIYLALRYLEDGVGGDSVGYAQCPADAQGGSVVSIAGVLLYQHP